MARTGYVIAGISLIAVLSVVAMLRVSAATFDSDIVPDASGSYGLGVSEGDWSSINDTIFFSGSNVGIGEPSPTSRLHVRGDVLIDDGDVYIDNSSNGVILKDITDACWRLTVGNSGALSTATTTCP